MRQRLLFALAAAASLMTAPVAAQDVERFQLERTEDGYVRLDTVTGEMTLCEERSNRLICRSVEERTSRGNDRPNRRVRQLADRVEALEERVAALEAGSEPDLPTEEEFEKTLGYMERFFRSFIGIVEELDKESEPEQPRPEPQPDRS